MLLCLFIPSIFSAFLANAGQTGIIILGIISLVFYIIAIVLSCKFAIRLAHRFGKSTAFGVVAWSPSGSAPFAKSCESPPSPIGLPTLPATEAETEKTRGFS